jgi:hypothetical protein
MKSLVLSGAAILAILSVAALTSEQKMLTELKRRYVALLHVMRQSGDPMWVPVLKPAIITGIHGKKDGVIGSNVNKGYEIYICLDGDDVNSAMYVLIHELAHMSVPEYDHTSGFWGNFSKLRDLAANAGLYVKPTGPVKYCGETV